MADLTEASLLEFLDEIKRRFEPDAFRAQLRAEAMRVVPSDRPTVIEHFFYDPVTRTLTSRG